VPEEVNSSGEQPTTSSDFVLSQGGTPIAFAQPHSRALHWLE
jgi:hypothetical protein